ncbi:uncharacterized protein V3H82_007507 [Fundulus diaphanus]
MFPSSGLFIHINCPFWLCERPHCLYKHATESRETFGGLFKSAVVDLTGRTGDQYDGSFTPVSENSLHELERLEKEIETAKHEVEQEQRRLSCYQTNQAERSGNALGTKRETGVSYGLCSSKDHNSHVQAKKYVVGNSKPRTDLEYDPLSNFTAALQSYSSSAKERKGKSQQDGRSSGGVRSGERPSTRQAQMYRPPSPEILEDSIEEGVLVIDVSLSPDKTSDQAQNTADLSGKSAQDAQREAKEIKKGKQFLDSPPKMKTEAANAASSSASKDNARKVPSDPTESDPVLSNFKKTKVNRNEDRSVANLTGCLEELRRRCENAGFKSPERVKKPTESADFSNISEQPYHLSSPQPHPASQLKRPAPKQASITEQGEAQNVPSVIPEGEKVAVKTSTKAFMSQRRAEAGQGGCQAQNVTSVNPPGRTESSETTKQPLQQEEDEVIMISSSSEKEDDDDDDEEEEEENEINYSEIELSDSDPMEECYRIFMEANSKEGEEEECSTSVRTDPDVQKPQVNASAPTLRGKKRVAHEAKNSEQPLTKRRPEPQILVPLREPGAVRLNSRSSVTSRIQQVKQRAFMATAPVKSGQNVVPPVSQKQTLPSASTPTPKNLQPSPVQNAYLNCIPLGTAVIEVGNNVHLVLPEGSFPISVASSSTAVTPVLTPVTQVHPNAAAAAPSRYRPTAPLLIPAPPRRPALSSALASTSSQSAVGPSTASQPAAQAAVKPLPVKRKLKQQSEAGRDKVPHDVRQRYLNMFTQEFLKTTADVNEAFEKALAEEKNVYNRSTNKLKYLSVSVNVLKRLKSQSATAKNEKQVQSQRPKGNIPFQQRKIKENAGDTVLYEIFKGYTLSDEQMIENNYPVQHPEKPGSAVLFSEKKASTDPLKRICCRCGATYSVDQTGKHLRKEECNYHYGKGVTKRVPGGVETRYSCCQGVMGAPGCQMFKLHVHDFLSLDGFVSTSPRRPSDVSCPGVYSLDCEMCYTVQGLELSRVTVINSDLQVIYDTFVRPDNEVIDYNTRFSGISEDDVKGNHTSLREVQETLLSFISADTILVGHGLETDLCLLKLLHEVVVDTSVVFPHRLGPPNKLSLNSLTAEYLRRIIQESVCGHDTAEDAAACLELMLWKMKEDGKLKK